MTPSSDKLVGLLATPQRLQIVAAVVLGARTPSEVATATGLAQADVVAGVTRLVRGGLISVDGAGFSLDPQVFGRAARAGASTAEPVDFGVSDPKVAAALRRYLVDEGLLGREHGVYWRTGGWVDVL